MDLHLGPPWTIPFLDLCAGPLLRAMTVGKIAEASKPKDKDKYAEKGKEAATKTKYQGAADKAEQPPAPAVQVQADNLMSDSGGASTPAAGGASTAPVVPVLPSEAEAASYNEEKTESLMRAVFAYNKHHLRRVTCENTRWFKGWQDVPFHQQQPLAIRKPWSPWTRAFVSPWNREEAMTSFHGTGTYTAAGNLFWLNPFVDKGRPKLLYAAGDPPLYATVLEASESFALHKTALTGVAQGVISTGKEARFKFHHTFTTFAWVVSEYNAPYFCSSLPLVSGHVGLWGFHIALMRALAMSDMPAVAVLVQAALCAPIEGVVVTDEETLSQISMANSDIARMHYDYLKNSFPSFARKLMVVLGNVEHSPKARLDFCSKHGIRYNGTIVDKKMLTAAQNCTERLDDRALMTLRSIDLRIGRGKNEITSTFSTLNRIMQFCQTDVQKANGVAWGSMHVRDLVNHVLYFIAWALDNNMVAGGAVTIAWLDKSRDGKTGEMKMLLAKISVYLFIETLVQDLPDTSAAKKDFVAVLANFSSYAVFAKVFAIEEAVATEGAVGGASTPAAADADGEVAVRTVATNAYTRVKEMTAGVAVQLLEFMYDLFCCALDNHGFYKFLSNDANTNIAVCQIKWEDWDNASLVTIRRMLSLHMKTVSASEITDVPLASTRGLKRSLSWADGDEGEGEDANDRDIKEIAKEREEALRCGQTFRRNFLTTSCIKTKLNKMSTDVLDKWWLTQSAARGFAGIPGKSHRVFVLSGEKWDCEASDSPWADEAEATASMIVAIDWIMAKQGPFDVLLCFDGCSSKIRAVMQQKLAKARHSNDIWIVYQSRREAVGRKVVFAARNREVCWVSFPVSRANIPTPIPRQQGQHTKSRIAALSAWDALACSSTVSGVVPMSWGQLPSMTLADKAKIIGRVPPVPLRTLFDADLGCPLFWQEVKPKELWSSLLFATHADFVVELGAGGGVLACACLSEGIPWTGLCLNPGHVHWINNVLDRFACELLTRKPGRGRRGPHGTVRY
jgi:hypothetical protein